MAKIRYATNHPETNEVIYAKHGYRNRADYLDALADDYGPVTYALADILGPSEDFDGLVTALEDHSDGY